LMAAEGLSNAEIGRRRLIQTGAVPITWAAMVAEPQRDWAREQPLPGVAQLQAQPCGGSGIAFPWETQLLATPGPGVGAPARRSPTDPNRQRRGPTPGAPPPARRSDSLRERQSEPRSRRRSSWTKLESRCADGVAPALTAERPSPRCTQLPRCARIQDARRGLPLRVAQGTAPAVRLRA
jgi:hypothetical protein